MQHHRRRQHLRPPQLPLAHRPPGAIPAGRSFLQLAGRGDSTEPLSHGAGSWPWLAPAAADKGCTAAAQGNLSSPAASQSSLCTPQPTKAAAEPRRGRQKDPNFPLQPDTLQAAAARGIPLGRAQLPKPCNITYLTQPLLFVGSSGLSFFFFFFETYRGAAAQPQTLTLTLTADSHKTPRPADNLFEDSNHKKTVFLRPTMQATFIKRMEKNVLCS